MAVDPITPLPAEPGIVFPYQLGANYADVIRVGKIPDPQRYTIYDIYNMVRVALEDVKVSSSRISLLWFFPFFREILNDYSSHIGEFQLAIRYTGGGGIFKIPNMRDIVALDVNGYGATRISEQGMIQHRAAGATLRTDEFLYSLNGNMLNLYPAIGDSDTITILASVFASDFNEDGVDTILPQADGMTLYHGTLWKCLEAKQKPFEHERKNYLTSRAERKSRVERQLYPSQLKPDSFLRL